MSRPFLLDLFAGAGGCAAGYHRAGFEVVGVDLAPQPRYPYAFIQGDALEVMDRLLDGETVSGARLADFDAIHSSPPCQFKALATLSQRLAGKEYPDLLTPMRPRLEASGLPWVIENVPDTPMRPDLKLCGCMFGLELPGRGLQLRRERWFETSWRAFGFQMPHRHHGYAISIAGHGTPQWMRAKTGHVEVAEWRQVMGISWTTRDELTEAVPPAYCEHVGALLLEHLAAREAA